MDREKTSKAFYNCDSKEELRNFFRNNFSIKTKKTFSLYSDESKHNL